MALRDVVDELLDDLDAGDEDRVVGRLVDEQRRLGVDRGELGRADGAALVNGLTDDVHDAAERFRADRHLDLGAGVGHFGAAHQTLGGVHGDGADHILAKVLRDLENEALVAVAGLERGENLRQFGVELNVDNGADHLGDAADVVRGGLSCCGCHVSRPLAFFLMPSPWTCFRVQCRRPTLVAGC